ncbi:sialidase family protein [Longimicrobium terrae]|uniref:Exo-alpha-sialidase n=1 Tax=Longimicrobium terrae TaxID=1639882 RepID=A0A841H775_9BACT|nr:sialidase family protein [Longimicrobium terrae]MBB4637894.1 hypothetical protein [Longimicrobium terrae]MBB6074011.1 hypothetical protein [Longimicrobium terrae]NNC31172.1 exo-alpha-sialidase [Longimicrobium terrae]
MNRLAMTALAAVILAVPAIAVARDSRSAHLSMTDPGVAATGAAGNPTAAVDARGEAGYVAWIDGDGAQNVFLARVDAQGRPGEPVRVNDRDGDAAPHEQAPAQVAVGSDGAVYVLWQNNREIPGRRFPASDLRFARSTDGGRTFSPAVTVNDDRDGRPSSHTFHDLTVGADGTVWVSWIDSRVRDSARAARPHGAAAPDAAAPSMASSSKPMGGKGAGGHSMGGHGGGANPADDDLPTSEIRIARSTDGGRTFGASRVVDAGACPCCRTSMAVAPDGTVYVAWRKEYAGDVRDVVIASLKPGADAFTPPVRVHEDAWVFPACPHAGPSVAVDAGGRLHVGWYTGREGRQGLWYASAVDGGKTYSAPVSLAANVPPSRVELAAQGESVLAAWDAGGRPASVQVARIDESGRIARFRTVPGRMPALDASGEAAVLAWHDHSTIRLARLESRGSVLGGW